MENIIISTAAQVSYKYNGLFESSSPDWIHMSRTLKEYQLIIVTEGTLHIADSEKDYTVNQDINMERHPPFVLSTGFILNVRCCTLRMKPLSHSPVAVLYPL